MVAPFDVFSTELDGIVVWLECCAELGVAKTRVQSMKPGNYLILNQRTGQKLFVEVKPSKTVAD